MQKNISPKPVIWLCLPVPAWQVNGQNGFGIDGKIILNEIIPIIKKIAADLKLNTIDLQTALSGMKDHFSDGVHPDEVGLDSIAANIYRALAQVTTSTYTINTQFFPDIELKGHELSITLPSHGGGCGTPFGSG
ncbi:MAG: hypothetical protein M3Y08_20445 [Fibrobacterota bacterium]|nr:hypothetical protein [Fibrobacterota bacterium]